MEQELPPDTRETEDGPPVPIRPVAELDEIDAEIVEHSFNGILIEQDGRIVVANTVACGLLAAESCEELNGMSIDAFLPDPFWGSVKERLLRVHKGEPLVSPIETTLERLDGKVIDIEAVGVPIVFESGPGIEIVFRDITKRKQTERTLQFTQHALDHASDATYWLRAGDGSIIYANDRASRDLGYDIEELMGMTVFDIEPDGSIEDWTAAVDRLKESGYSRSTTELKTKDGRMVPVEITQHFLEYQGRPFIIACTRSMDG